MKNEPSLDDLWKSAEAGEGSYRPDAASELPEAARCYLEHTIAPATPLANAVRLRMHGEIKLRGWLPFRAEEVIHREQGMIWSASVRMFGLPIRGSDRLVDGAGAMRWKLLGIVPVMSASGADITRSAVGRVQAESVWLPSLLCGTDVTWSVTDASEVRAAFTAYGSPAELALGFHRTGRLESVKLQRWGNPEGAEFHYADFGGVAEDEGTFGGYTIPTRLRIGWYFGTDRFESEGEFFRATIEEATYR